MVPGICPVAPVTGPGHPRAVAAIVVKVAVSRVGRDAIERAGRDAVIIADAGVGVTKLSAGLDPLHFRWELPLVDPTYPPLSRRKSHVLFVFSRKRAYRVASLRPYQSIRKAIFRLRKPQTLHRKTSELHDNA